MVAPRAPLQEDSLLGEDGEALELSAEEQAAVEAVDELMQNDRLESLIEVQKRRGWGVQQWGLPPPPHPMPCVHVCVCVSVSMATPGMGSGAGCGRATTLQQA